MARFPDFARHTAAPITLAQLRWQRGLSQADLARLTGLRQETICRAERGKASTMRPSSVRALADALTEGDTARIALAFIASKEQASRSPLRIGSTVRA